MKYVRLLLPLLVVGASLVGCTKKELSNTAAQPPASSTEPTASSAPASEHVAGQTEQVSTEGSPSDILGRAHQEEKELGEIIANGQLKSVHVKAFAIRDLVVAAAGKATSIAGSDKAALDQEIAQVKSLAGELDEAGDASNLAKTKSLYSQLKTELRVIDKRLGISGQ